MIFAVVLIVAQLVKKFPRLAWNPKVHYRVHKSLSLDPTLSKMDPVHNLIPYFFKTHFNIILPSMSMSSK
jgi:hypothetical protein